MPKTTFTTDRGPVTWVSVVQPTADEIEQLAKEYQLSSLLIEDATVSTERARIRSHDDHTVAIIKPALFDAELERLTLGHWAIITNEQTVITIATGQADVAQKLFDSLTTGPTKELRRNGIDAIVHRCIDVVVDDYFEILSTIYDKATDLEALVFAADAGQNLDYTEEIYRLKRTITTLRRAVDPLAAEAHRYLTGPLLKHDTARPYFQDLFDHITSTSEGVEAVDRLLSDALQADLARINTLQNTIALRQNEDMRKFSAWAAIGAVPTIISGIFGMNFAHMAPLQWEQGFALSLGLMLVICLGLYTTFRRNNWL